MTDFLPEHLPRLSRRERELVQAHLDGLDNKGAAARLGISLIGTRALFWRARVRLGLRDGRLIPGPTEATAGATDFVPEHLPLLAPRQRQVVEARLAGLTPMQTAEKLGIGADAVRSALCIARRRLHLPEPAEKMQPPTRAHKKYGSAFKAEDLVLLTPRVREVVELYMADKSAPDIGEALGIGAKHVQDIIRRARVAIADGKAVYGRTRFTRAEIAAQEQAVLEAIDGGATLLEVAAKLGLPVTTARRRLADLEARLGRKLGKHYATDDTGEDSICRCGVDLDQEDIGEHACFVNAREDVGEAADYLRLGTEGGARFAPLTRRTP